MSKNMSVEEIIHGVWANDYNFENIGDLAVAALVRAVLGDLEAASRRELLERIVSQDMREIVQSGEFTLITQAGQAGRRTVEACQVFHDTWIGVDKGLIAELINEGKNLDTSGWNEASHNKAYKRAVKFLKYDFLPNIDGSEYVKDMPDELARFLTDCWLAA